MPVAGRSPRPSGPWLTACPLRFGILPALAPIARLPGTGSPSLAASSATSASRPVEQRVGGTRRSR